MENPKQAFVKFTSSRTDEAGGKWNSSSPKHVHFVYTITISSKEYEPREIEIIKRDTKENDHEIIVKVEEKSKESKNKKGEEKDDSEYIDTNPPSPPDPSVLFIIEKFYIMFVEIIKNYDDSSEEELEEDGNAVTRELGVEYIDRFLTRSKLTYHKYLMKDPEGIRGISKFTRRIRGMHIFVENFTYVLDFMIVEDISSIIDPGLSQVMLGKPFVEVSNMTHDLSIGIVKFTIMDDEIAHKMPHKIEQFNSLSNLEK
uniref:Retrotransposon Orf1 n=1 Tax=Tanacetum cinerariifolium TaxID=118510 RepID=A0A6L2LFB7_TANCI|nr:retrotransposon Orf1 [Tanacetum cinerariifolium]